VYGYIYTYSYIMFIVNIAMYYVSMINYVFKIYQAQQCSIPPPLRWVMWRDLWNA
jgi:hypothetical protein